MAKKKTKKKAAKKKVAKKVKRKQSKKVSSTPTTSELKVQDSSTMTDSASEPEQMSFEDAHETQYDDVNEDIEF